MKLSAPTALTLALSVTMAGCGCKNGGRCAEPPSESGLDNTALLGRPSPLSATVVAAEGNTTKFQIGSEQITLSTGYTGDVFTQGQAVRIDHCSYGMTDVFVNVVDPDGDSRLLFQSAGQGWFLETAQCTHSSGIAVDGADLDCCTLGAGCETQTPRGMKFWGVHVGAGDSVVLASGEEAIIQDGGENYRVANRRAAMFLGEPRQCRDVAPGRVFAFAIYRLRVTP